MARFLEKAKAIEFRKLGKSYSEIKLLLGVGKGTLSSWLRDMPLSEERIRELRDWNSKRIEKYRETRRKNREILLKEIYLREQKLLLSLLQKDLFTAGLFLYWGEGGKTKPAQLSLSNTSPSICIAFIFWLTKCLGINKKEIKIRLHLYRDMDIKTEVSFWIKILGISHSQFKKPYIKSSRFKDLNYKRGYGHGTCNVIVGNAILTKRVLMSLKVLEDYFKGPVA